MSNAVIDCLLNHRSIRKFLPKPIEQEKLNLILQAGIRAATGGNLQLYSFIVIDSDEKKKALDEAWEGRFIEMSNCPIVILALADLFRVRRWLEYHSDRPICTDKPMSFMLANWDALIALQNMVVAAESLGLGTCYIGSGLEMDISKIFGTPEYVFPAALVCIGYPDESPKLSMRLPMDAVIHHNEYHMPTDNDIIEWYRERDALWDNVSSKIKKRLAEQNIDGIAQALSVQKFSPEIVERRSKGIRRNLRTAGFDLSVSTSPDSKGPAR